MLKTLAMACGLTCLLTSCGGIRHYLHTDVPAPAGQQLAPVALTVGESVKAVKHTRGVAIAGGYVEGITIEDPTIAMVRYGIDGNGDRFDPVVRIVGLRPGTTRAAYGNRLGEKPKFAHPNTSKMLPHSFLIHVTDPSRPASFPTRHLLTNRPALDGPS